MRTEHRMHKNQANLARDKETTPAYQVKLERVLGLTVASNAALACDPETEVVAYPAGCTVVLYNPRKNKQTHLLNSSRKTITCLAFSGDGRYLVTGESGHLPSVRVWDLQDGAGQVAEFAGHKYGINCVAFSPSSKYVVSVGSQHDMIVNVWDWRGNLKVASNKVSAKVKAVSFAENGNYFVTVGNRHVKFWYLEYSRSAKYKEAVPLMGRSAILGEQRNNHFCDVACGRGEMGDSTYAITKSGLLCEFNNRRLLDKWVELRTTSANCMAVGENLIFIGCAEGIVRCFSPATLRFVTTLPRTHYLGVDVAKGLTISHMASIPSNAKYPDAVALAYDHKNSKLTCVYNDHSLYIWDVRDIKRVGKSHSFLFHSACIWGVDMYPDQLPEGSTGAPAMPPGCFVTCSSDDTVRVWNLDPNLPQDNSTMYQRNIYSSELLKVLYVDRELTYLKDTDLSGASEKSDSSYDGRNGVRSVRISPDGQHLASGDRSGNIRIHELSTLQELCRIEAHDAEVLCLEYSRPESGRRLLASASRDRLIHVFSVDQEYSFLQTLDDHSSSITAVRFLNSLDQLQMVSCGADKSIIFRQLQGSPGGTQCQFSRGHNIAGKTTLYDMEVDSGQKHILTACQDRNIRVYNVGSGKQSKTFKGSVGEDGSLIKVVLDSSGIYAATSCTDKTLCVYEYYSGECMATMFGHSELVTGLRFTSDCRRLVSASGDGCIFVWKVPHDMVVTMHARLAQQAARASRKPVQVVNGIHLDNEKFGPPPPDFLDPNANNFERTDYRFSVGQLPLWAKKQISEHNSPPPSLGNNRQMDPPKGRWAQRLDPAGLTIKSVYENDSVIPFPLASERRLDSDGSKDSSIDSGTEVRQYAEFRRETVVISKQVDSKVSLTRGDMTELTRNRHLTDDSSIGSYKYEDLESTEHDGDVEDYSEGEGESTEPEQTQRLMYYPPAEETGSDFTVNAMDAEELRRSQRRMKKSQRPERLVDLTVTSVSASVSGSQDSDEEDEEASTPSADTVERNLLSMLSMSTESLDHMGHREKYLKNTFESLSGAEMEASKDAAGTSISSQFLVRSGQTPARNVAVINAARQTRIDTGASNKREELQRRIEETRRKLQSVGYRSNLKVSQSITDLSHIPTRDKRPPNHAHRYTAAGGKHYATVLVHRYRRRLSLCPGLSLLCPFQPPLEEPPAEVQPAAPVVASSSSSTSCSSVVAGLSVNPAPTNSVPANESCKTNISSAANEVSKANAAYCVPLDVANPHTNEACKTKVTTEACKTNMATEAWKANLAWSIPMEPGGEGNKRPGSLALGPRYPRTYRKPHPTHQSLPESPVCEKEATLTDTEAKRRSCSYYIDLTAPRPRGGKSSESLPARFLAASSEENLDDDGGNFSSDSLEEPSETSSRAMPRRSASDYQLSWDPEQDRHSSASFFLSRRHQGRSQESVLSNESILESDREASHCYRSTESILTDDSSDCRELFHPREESGSHRAVFRTRSLQDTAARKTCYSLSRPQTPTPREEDPPERRARPPTAPKPSIPTTGKVTHKPPLKPRQKPSQQLSKAEETRAEEGCKSPAEPWVTDAAKLHSPFSGNCFLEGENIGLRRVGAEEDRGPMPRSESMPAHMGVKYLRRSFENVLDDMSEDEGRPPRAPPAGNSGSSTPATSSSAANSPKRLWPPASRAPVQRQLAKRLGGKQAILPNKFGSVSGKVSSKGSSGAMRTLPRKQLTSSNMTRSISMGRLNQSDSESDLGLAQRPLGSSRVNGFNRPTISSQNKVTANQNSGCKTNLNGPTNRRRGLTGAQSSTTLNQVGNNEDSSSEETSSVGGKPVPSMRPRSTSIERFSGAPLSLPAHSGQPQPPPRRGSSIHGRYNSERDLSRTARDVTQRLTSANRGKPVPAARHHGLETGSQDSLLDNVASAPLSEQLCSAVAEQLTRSIDNFSQLHQRLALEGDQDLLKTLEQTASEALQTLRQVSPSTPAPVAPPANPTEDGKNVVAMMQQYSDLLVNMVQQRMGQNSPAAQKPS